MPFGQPANVSASPWWVTRRQIERELLRLDVDPGGTPHLLIEHADQVVAMEERAIAIRKKRNASLRVCARLVKEGRAHGMVTAGHTGAAMIAAKTVIGTIPGVDRPALAGVLPNRSGRTVLLDVGANISAKSRHLCQFAVMGHFYAQEILGPPKPRVGLLSVGEEEGKGTDTIPRGLSRPATGRPQLHRQRPKAATFFAALSTSSSVTASSATWCSRPRNHSQATWAR